MKRQIFLTMLWLLFLVPAIAQNPDTLTNSSVVKMVNAKLSDELIIDVIGNSVVNFDLSGNSFNELLQQKVSLPVIEAMKKASASFTEGESVTPVSSEKYDPVIRQEPKSDPTTQNNAAYTEPPAAVFNFTENAAYGYVVPVLDLIVFHESEIKKFMTSVDEWSTRIDDLTTAAKNIEEEINRTEKELIDLKNSDSKAYSGNIITTRKKLNEQREALQNAREEILKAGEKSAAELEKISSESIKACGSQYNDVSQDIKSYETDPAGFVKGTPVKQSALNIDEEINPYFSPVLEIPAWHKNKIREAEQVIRQWNEKVKTAVIKAEEIEGRMNQFKQKLSEYQTDQKKYKNEITAVKKQISAVEKEKKTLIDKIKDDCNELSGFYRQENSDIQKILDQRFADIIENINYSFKENPIL